MNDVSQSGTNDGMTPPLGGKSLFSPANRQTLRRATFAPLDKDRDEQDKRADGQTGERAHD